MPTHDYIIANGTGAAVRADINLALSAIVSLNSSASEPATMYAYQLWADTAAGLLKIRNGANSAWITLRQLDGDFSIVAVEDGLQATPSLTFTNDLNTGVFRSGTDALAIVTGGQYAITCTSTQAVGIKTANPSTALHVAGNARVGADDVTDAHLQIGKGATGNRNSYIDIVGDTTYTDYGLRVIRNNTGANATSELKHRGTGALNFTTEEAAPIVFNTTNSPALTITSGALVGVGTSSPNQQLELQGANAYTSRLRFSYGSSAPTYFADWGYSSDGNKVYLTITDNNIAKNVLVANYAGNVGIGVTTVDTTLHIKGANTSGRGQLYIQSTATNVFPRFVLADSANTTYLDVYGDTSNQEVIRNTGSGGKHVWQINSSEAARIDSSGRLLVGTSTQVGNVNGGILQLGSGITFPATAVAASDANTLDDYEEGTWTPGLAGQTTAGSYAYDSDRTGGKYIKIGKKVFVQGVFRVTTVTTAGSGDANITGLPFPSVNVHSIWARTLGSIAMQTGPSLTSTAIFCISEGNSASYLTIAEQDATSWIALPVTDVDTVNTIWFFQITYETT